MVIRMRHTRSHTKNRRSHHALKTPTLSVCSNCGAKHRPHHMCLECGFYKGKMVIDMAAKKKARAERITAKKAAIAEQEAQFAPETDPNQEQQAALETGEEKAQADTKTDKAKDTKDEK